MRNHFYLMATVCAFICYGPTISAQQTTPARSTSQQFNTEAYKLALNGVISDNPKKQLRNYFRYRWGSPTTSNVTLPQSNVLGRSVDSAELISALVQVGSTPIERTQST